ncbi:MAG: RecQ family ATP-dependent DNA helicase [Cyclobacteriaceae bacterium]
MSQPKDILKQYWNFEAFRPQQEEIINSVLQDNDTLALLPTGGGKSICFQIPTMVLPGMCLVITPLIALMKDQVEQLSKRKIPANAIYSGMPRREIDIILDNCVYGKYKFLYVSPERLKTDLFIERLKKMQVSLLAIDEAHCISQWGYDFRPSYLEIQEIYPYIGEARKIALTATATEEVSEDICDKLSFKGTQIYRRSFARKNLSYSAFELENKEQKVFLVLKNVKGSAIVYVRSRKETARISRMLMQGGISASYYHAGLGIKERAQRQNEWLQNKVRVIVATNAFGMGIDKPDVRVVIHLDIPDSLEAYYQEAGRAGRDGRNAFAVLLYNQNDITQLKENFKRSFPTSKYLKRVYQSLSNYYKLAVGSSQWQSFDFQIDAFSKSYKLNQFDTFHAIKKLEEHGLILLNESFYKPSMVLFSVGHEEMYKYCIANAKLEPLIKGMLRLYGGDLYAEFVKINEYDLARLIKSSAAEVGRNLEYLDKSNVLVYDKMKEKPQLTFLTARKDAANLGISKLRESERREVIGNKINKIIAYATTRNECRTRIFQEYFNEAAYLNCGVCDECLKAKREQKEQNYSRQLLIAIRKALEGGQMNVQKLKGEVQSKNDFLFTECLRILIDDGELEIDDLGVSRLLKPKKS